MNYLIYAISGFIVLRLVSKWRRNHNRNLELSRKLEKSIREKSTAGSDKVIDEFQDYVALVGERHVPLDLPRIVYDSHLKVLQRRRFCHGCMTSSSVAPQRIEAVRQSIAILERKFGEFQTTYIKTIE